MLYLYALLVLSLAAILWAVWAIAKHVRTHAAEELRGEDGIQPEAVSVASDNGVRRNQQTL